MKDISVTELHNLRQNGADIQLIDIREPFEAEICNIGGELIPMGEVLTNLDKIHRDKQVVIHCKSGGRSSNLIQYLEQNYQFTNLYNLQGGILAWAREIDPSISTY